MSPPAVVMSDVTRYFDRTPGYIIEHEGGDMFIKKLPNGSSTRGKKVVRIGHQFLGHTKTISPGIIKKIERTFGVTRQDLLG